MSDDMTVSEVLREANRIADKKLEIFHRAMESLQEEEQRRMNNMKISIDKKYRTRGGQSVQVICTSRDEPYPVVALIGTGSLIETFTSDGRYLTSSAHTYDLVEIHEWCDFQIDEPVMVRRTENGIWYKRFFAGVSEFGKPRAWEGGAVKWSAKVAVVWNECRRPIEEELELK